MAGVIADRAISKSTNAQQANSNLSDRWEYCVISGVKWNSDRKMHYARICYFRSSGCHEVEIEAPQLSEADAGDRAISMTLAKAAATLGQSGWEMVGEFVAYGDRDQRRLYFKRRQKC